MKSKNFLASLNDKSVEELNLELVNTKKELFNLRFQNATNQLDNTARINEVRKNIARIQTVITQRVKGEKGVKRLSRAARKQVAATS